MTKDPEALIGQLTDIQRSSLIVCIDLLDHMAGEGMGCHTPDGLRFADEALADLFEAFFPEYTGDIEYTDFIRARLRTDPAS